MAKKVDGDRHKEVVEERDSRTSCTEMFTEQNTNFVKDKGSKPSGLIMACSKKYPEILFKKY